MKLGGRIGPQEKEDREGKEILVDILGPIRYVE